MNQSNLLSQANKAFQLGNNESGLSLLREFNRTGSANAGSWHQQAVVEEQIGDILLAGHAHYQCIKAAPHIAMSYVYAAYWLEKQNQTDAAAALYSLAQEADPSSLSIDAQQTKANSLRAFSGQNLLTHYLSSQHRNLFPDRTDTLRIKNAIWTRTHDSSFEYDDHQFAPNLFWIPDLDCPPYHDVSQFEWSAQCVEGTSQIKEELSNALRRQQMINDEDIEPEIPDSPLLRPYLPENSIVDGDLQTLAGSMQWSALDLYRDGELNSAVADLFPKTLAIIDSVSCYKLDQHPFEVFFSILQPQQSIAPHFGQSNHALTVHLPLIVPQDCYLEVANEKRQWREGELIIFDDSYYHSAHNNSDQLRVVLIFSVWHPDLSLQEQQAIQLSFKTRREWMQKRTEKLSRLLNK